MREVRQRLKMHKKVASDEVGPSGGASDEAEPFGEEVIDLCSIDSGSGSGDDNDDGVDL